jgi:hypothetical protein
MKTEEKVDYLIAIQSELKAEDILEAVKPLLKKYGCCLTITERTSEIAGYLVLTSRATFSDGETNRSVEAQAGINPERKGMDIAQSFGSSSSYAKKYALGNLFLLDDTKDADSNKVNEPIAKKLTKSPLDDGQLQAMIVAVGKGEGAKVKERLAFYTLTTKQSKIINDVLNADKKEEKSNGVLGIIDELNSIEVPKEYNSNNQK